MRAGSPVWCLKSVARTVLVLVATIGVLMSGMMWPASQAGALQAKQLRLVSAIPGAHTPSINDGVVDAIAQVGDMIILGGTFTSVSPVNDPTKTYTVDNVVEFNAKTGVIALGFMPSLNGPVATITPGPSPHQVYIGGSFTTVDGKVMRVALLNITTGTITPSWKPSNMVGTIGRIILRHGRLFVGGTFTWVGGEKHAGLVALRPKSGIVTPYVNINFFGHHNYGVNCNPQVRHCARGRVGIKSMDINPAGTRLIAVGNFTNVGGFHRDQVALLELGKSKVWVDRHWKTGAYTAACAKAFDSYVRDVQFSPNGSYFVVVAAGALGRNKDGTKSSCDAAARFNTNTHGADIRPVWLDYTGMDSLWSVAVTGTAVYVGGHQRWENNPYGKNKAAAGAVPRPGVAALSPINGLPLSWNPGRTPRGAGCFALFATAAGLWVGSDTETFGPGTAGHPVYTRPRIAFFPLVGGLAVPADRTPGLPGRLYLAGATSSTAKNHDRLVFREFNGRSLGKPRSVGGGIAWGSVHGAFYVDGKVVYGKSNGNLYERSFNGSAFGAEVVLDPYHDPIWDSVRTGSGTQTYRGVPSTFSSQIPSVTSMFYRAGRLFYTQSGRGAMHWRWFAPQPGVVGASEFTVHGPRRWSHVAGAVLAGNQLYYASRTGELRSVRWRGVATTGKTKLVSAAKNWASRGLFLLSHRTNPTARPNAAFTARCGAARCTFHARPWVDPDGGVVKYAWRFGDGTSAPASTAGKVSHRYRRHGRHGVTLTVTTTGGSRAAVTHRV